MAKKQAGLAGSILSPKSDLIFKNIFGDQRNADILASFLRAVLDLPEDDYERLTIVDPHLRPDEAEGKLGVLDVKLHTKSGKVINIEIQVSSMPDMRQRIIFYLARMVTEQISSSEEYAVIKKTVSILITDHVLIDDNDQYHNRYRLYDAQTASELTDIIEAHTLELPKLPTQEDGTLLWSWMRFLQAREKEELQMLSQDIPQIQKAVGVLLELSADERMRLLYEAREKARMDEASRMRGARMEGRAEGLAEGRAEVQAELIQNMLKKGMSMTDAAEITGLSAEEVKLLAGRG